jgi:hypothetical protein
MAQVVMKRPSAGRASGKRQPGVMSSYQKMKEKEEKEKKELKEKVKDLEKELEREKEGKEKEKKEKDIAVAALNHERSSRDQLVTDEVESRLQFLKGPPW